MSPRIIMSTEVRVERMSPIFVEKIRRPVGGDYKLITLMIELS